MSRLKKLASAIDEYGQDYANKDEKVTPYHILFKNHGNEIASLDKEEAVQFCLDIISRLNSQYDGDVNYYEVSDEERGRLLQALEDEEVDSGMDVLFVIKDFLLQTEGLEVNSSRLKKLCK